MVDIHTHILPNVDDGSTSLEDSLTMLREEVEQGVDTVILTPHHHLRRGYRADVEGIQAAYKTLVSALEAEGLQVKLLLGQEIYYHAEDDISALLKAGKLLTLGGTNKVLVEFPFERFPSELFEFIYELRVSGYVPVVAHVERYRWTTVDIVERLKKSGALIQVNADSVIGKCGLKIKWLVKKLVKKGLVDLVASDVHSFRPSCMAAAYKKLGTPSLFEF